MKKAESMWECTICSAKGRRWLTSLNARRGAREHIMKFHPTEIENGIVRFAALPIIHKRETDGT
jgi:hypothetical protein